MQAVLKEEGWHVELYLAREFPEEGSENNVRFGPA